MVLDNKVSILVKKKFIDLVIKMISENKYKAQIAYFFNDGKYQFTYNVRKTTLELFLNLGVYNNKIFQARTSITV